MAIISIPTRETERLILRPFTTEDVDAYHTQIRGDPDVMQFLLSKPQTREQVATIIERLLGAWERDKLGMWAVIEKASGAFIGHAGLWMIQNTPDVEVAYALGKAYWGKGYATEAARESLRFGFEDCKLPKIVAVAKEENAASRHVLEKIGMAFVGMTDRYYNLTLPTYEIDNPNP